jgi:hypothetical protein
MKTLATKLAIATSIALATLAATEAAYAQSPRHHAEHRALQSRPAALPNDVGQGYYDGNYEFNVDRSDRASSPYAGGGGL